MHKTHMTSRITIAADKPAIFNIIASLNPNHSLLQPIIEDLRSLLAAGFVIMRHQLGYKDFFHLFVSKVPPVPIILGLDFAFSV